MGVHVRDWLTAAGFGRYIELFEQHEIDADALPALTESHLKEMGLPLGPRVKLHVALQQLVAQGGLPAAQTALLTETAAPDAAPAPATTVAPTTAAAERRQLTVMFIDLVGSTALSTQLDPEDLRLVVRGYQGVVAAEVHRVGGHVAQYLGDGVMAYFGYPVAHEGEAERAVRAAQAIVTAVPALRLPGGHQLAVRIGMASGLVVVGDLLGQGSAREHAVVGETPNLAARLQGLADPGQIIISAQTRELVRHAFETVDLGQHALKGLAAPVAVYRLGAEVGLAGSDGQGAEPLGAMVGREHELAMLLERWHTAASGEGQLVVLTGDPGIGKTRIARALQDALQGVDHARLKLQCSPYHSDSALHPFIQYMKRSTGIQPGDSPEVQLDKLETTLGAYDPAGKADAPVLAAMLGLDGSSRYGALDLPPHQLRYKTLEALIHQSRLMADSRPLLLIFEDAHWMDPTTLELVEMYVERLPRSPVLMVVTARTGFRHSFGQVCDVSNIVLNRLGRAQIAAVASRVAGGKALPEAVIREITSKTDGVPLFAEELTKTLLASGALRETADAYVVAGVSRELAVPASLHDSLMARLDRLQPVKEVAQTAACIGRDFDLPLLSEVMQLAEDRLRSALEQLVQAELVFGRGSPPYQRYSFKHALVRDAAYGSLLRATRQQMHARLSAALARQPETPPELLAHHALQAGLFDQAIAAHQRAAQQAMARPAYKEAIAHLNHAVDLADRMGDAPPWPQRRLKLLLVLGQALIPLRGYGHAETVAAFLRAQQCAEAAGESQHRFSITYAVWVSRYIRGEQDQALAIARDMVELARAAGVTGHTVSALRCLAISQMITGSPALSETAFDEAAKLSGPVPSLTREQRAALAQRFAADPAIATGFHNGFAVWSQGDVDRAGRLVQAALAEARTMGHAHTLAHAQAHAAILAVFNRDAVTTQAMADETLDCAARHELEMWTGYGSVLKACGLAMAGDDAAAASVMNSGLEIIERTQTGAMVSLFHAVQARTLASLGRYDEAAHHADVVQRELRSGSERYFWPECLRLRGDYLLLCTEYAPSAAEAAYHQALQLAREQRARSWELYAALSLAQLWVSQGQEARARVLLEGVLAAWPRPPSLTAYEEAQRLLARLPSDALPVTAK